MAEAALADEHVRGGERLDLQRRILRLGKPPRRWRRPAWAAALPREPPEARPAPGAAPSLSTSPYVRACVVASAGCEEGAAARCRCCLTLAQPRRMAMRELAPAVAGVAAPARGRAARPAGDRAARARQVRIEGRPITSVLGAKSRFWAADGSAVGVEQLALLHYAAPEAGGWKGGRPRPAARATRGSPAAVPGATRRVALHLSCSSCSALYPCSGMRFFPCPEACVAAHGSAWQAAARGAASRKGCDAHVARCPRVSTT